MDLAMGQQENLHNLTLAQKEREKTNEQLAQALSYQPTSTHSTRESAHFNDALSQGGSLRSQPGALASLVTSLVSPFANVFAKKGTSTHETFDISTPGTSGSHSTAVPVEMQMATAIAEATSLPQGGESPPAQGAARMSYHNL